MRYSVLGKTGLKVSALGFGCMRLPEKNGRVDRELALPLLRRAVELGVNYFDTATMYCHSDSELALGEAMQGIREKVVISTKNPHRGPASTWRAQLEESLRRLRTDYIDVYHHHGINWGEWGSKLDPKQGGMTAQMLKAKEEGLIRHIGFSFHDAPEGLKRLADTGYYENVILQYNLLDQGNAEAMQYAHEKGMGIVVMGPVGGGRLGIANERIQELTGAKTTVEAAMRFVWAHPAVNIALSGMQDLKMLEENAALAATAKPFSSQEVGQLNELVRQRKEKSGLYCSGCRYCCPVCNAGIPIPEVLEMMNQELVFGIPKAQQYRRMKVGPAECLTCGRCVEACPQKIDIPAKLRQAAQMWDERLGMVITTASLQRVCADGSFEAALKVNNFAGQPAETSVEVSGVDGTIVSQAATSAMLEPFARRNVVVKGKVDPRHSRLALKTKTSAHGKTTEQATEFRYLLLPAAPTAGAGEGAGAGGWDGGTWHEFAPKAADFPDQKADRHRARFRAGREADALVVQIEVEDDFLAPTRADRDKGSYTVDCVELYLDGRAPGRCGQQAYEKGVYQIFVYPGTPGTEHRAFYHCGQAIQLEVQSEGLPGGRSGYRMVMRVPLAQFCVQAAPTVLGLDLAVNSADGGGKRVGQYAFAGDGNNWQDASRFARVWME